MLYIHQSVLCTCLPVNGVLRAHISTEGCGERADRGIFEGRHVRSCTVRRQISVAAKTKAQVGSLIVMHISGHIRYLFVSMFILPETFRMSNGCNVIAEKQ